MHAAVLIETVAEALITFRVDRPRLIGVQNFPPPATALANPRPAGVAID